MSKRRFQVRFSGDVVLELDDAVIEAVDDDWRKNIYSHLHTPEEIAQHLAFNAVANHARLSQLDGWADQPDANMTVDIDWDDWYVESMAKIE